MTLTKKERAIKKFEASMNRLDILGEELTAMITDENYVENARNSRQERMEKMKKRREEGKLKPVARVKDIKIRSLVSKMKKYSSNI